MKCIHCQAVMRPGIGHGSFAYCQEWMSRNDWHSPCLGILIIRGSPFKKQVLGHHSGYNPNLQVENLSVYPDRTMHNIKSEYDVLSGLTKGN